MVDGKGGVYSVVNPVKVARSFVRSDEIADDGMWFLKRSMKHE